MHYVILRDDDTNALTPVDCLDRLYRPFLDRNLPVNLALIPCVRTRLLRADGAPEQFLLHGDAGGRDVRPIASNPELTDYLHQNAGYHVVQHGCHHDLCEFDNPDRGELARRLQLGSDCLREAGFSQPSTFVAPHDKLSRPAFTEIVRFCPVISTGWFELGRTPVSWWPEYALKKITQTPHWRAGGAVLLGHPGCLLSYLRPYEEMLETIKQTIRRQRLTVLVTHWWEYFRDGKRDEAFINVLHQVAAHLAESSDIRVISFDDLVPQEVPLS